VAVVLDFCSSELHTDIVKHNQRTSDTGCAKDKLDTRSTDHYGKDTILSSDGFETSSDLD